MTWLEEIEARHERDGQKPAFHVTESNLAQYHSDRAYLLAEVKRLTDELARAMQNCVDEAGANDKLRHEIERLSAPVTDEECQAVAVELDCWNQDAKAALTAFLKGRMS